MKTTNETNSFLEISNERPFIVSTAFNANVVKKKKKKKKSKKESKMFKILFSWTQNMSKRALLHKVVLRVYNSDKSRWLKILLWPVQMRFVLNHGAFRKSLTANESNCTVFKHKGQSNRCAVGLFSNNNAFRKVTSRTFIHGKDGGRLPTRIGHNRNINFAISVRRIGWKRW